LASSLLDESSSVRLRPDRDETSDPFLDRPDDDFGMIRREDGVASGREGLMSSHSFSWWSKVWNLTAWRWTRLSRVQMQLRLTVNRLDS
jgi:hypothetical protein